MNRQRFNEYRATVKDRCGLHAVLEGFGLAIDAANKFKCFVHDDKKPSARINPDGTTWTCFACGARGDAIDAAIELGGFGHREAVEYLARCCGLGTFHEYCGEFKKQAKLAVAYVDLNTLTKEQRAHLIRAARNQFGGSVDKVAQRCVELVMNKRIREA